MDGTKGAQDLNCFIKTPRGSLTPCLSQVIPFNGPGLVFQHSSILPSREEIVIKNQLALPTPSASARITSITMKQPRRSNAIKGMQKSLELTNKTKIQNRLKTDSVTESYLAEKAGTPHVKRMFVESKTKVSVQQLPTSIERQDLLTFTPVCGDSSGILGFDEGGTLIRGPGFVISPVCPNESGRRVESSFGPNTDTIDEFRKKLNIPTNPIIRDNINDSARPLSAKKVTFFDEEQNGKKEKSEIMSQFQCSNSEIHNLQSQNSEAPTKSNCLRSEMDIDVVIEKENPTDQPKINEIGDKNLATHANKGIAETFKKSLPLLKIEENNQENTVSQRICTQSAFTPRHSGEHILTSARSSFISPFSPLTFNQTISESKVSVSARVTPTAEVLNRRYGGCELFDCEEAPRGTKRALIAGGTAFKQRSKQATPSAGVVQEAKDHSNVCQILSASNSPVDNVIAVSNNHDVQSIKVTEVGQDMPHYNMGMESSGTSCLPLSPQTGVESDTFRNMAESLFDEFNAKTASLNNSFRQSAGGSMDVNDMCITPTERVHIHTAVTERRTSALKVSCYNNFGNEDIETINFDRLLDLYNSPGAGCMMDTGIVPDACAFSALAREDEEELVADFRGATTVSYAEICTVRPVGKRAEDNDSRPEEYMGISPMLHRGSSYDQEEAGRAQKGKKRRTQQRGNKKSAKPKVLRSHRRKGRPSRGINTGDDTHMINKQDTNTISLCQSTVGVGVTEGIVVPSSKICCAPGDRRLSFYSSEQTVGVGVGVGFSVGLGGARAYSDTEEEEEEEETGSMSDAMKCLLSSEDRRATFYTPDLEDDRAVESDEQNPNELSEYSLEEGFNCCNLTSDTALPSGHHNTSIPKLNLASNGMGANCAQEGIEENSECGAGAGGDETSGFSDDSGRMRRLSIIPTKYGGGIGGFFYSQKENMNPQHSRSRGGIDEGSDDILSDSDSNGHKTHHRVLTESFIDASSALTARGFDREEQCQPFSGKNSGGMSDVYEESQPRVVGLGDDEGMVKDIECPNFEVTESEFMNCPECDKNKQYSRYESGLRSSHYSSGCCCDEEGEHNTKAATKAGEFISSILDEEDICGSPKFNSGKIRDDSLHMFREKEMDCLDCSDSDQDLCAEGSYDILMDGKRYNNLGRRRSDLRQPVFGAFGTTESPKYTAKDIVIPGSTHPGRHISIAERELRDAIEGRNDSAQMLSHIIESYHREVVGL